MISHVTAVYTSVPHIDKSRCRLSHGFLQSASAAPVLHGSATGGPERQEQSVPETPIRVVVRVPNADAAVHGVASVDTQHAAVCL